jgi:hypothetical protein
MARLHLTLIVCFCIAVGCKTNPTATEPLKHSNLPASDRVQIPVLEPGPDSASPTQLTWQRCPEAQGYELEERFSDTWGLIFVGNRTDYPLSSFTSPSSRTFRIRAVYSDVVSQWSDSLTVTRGGSL